MGGHEINSKGTFGFLEKLLNWQPRLEDFAIASMPEKRRLT
jgi:hypothetical protein